MLKRKAQSQRPVTFGIIDYCIKDSIPQQFNIESWSRRQSACGWQNLRLSENSLGCFTGCVGDHTFRWVMRHSSVYCISSNILRRTLTSKCSGSSLTPPLQLAVPNVEVTVGCNLGDASGREWAPSVYTKAFSPIDRQDRKSATEATCAASATEADDQSDRNRSRARMESTLAWKL